jgi:hypothetical protein
MSSIADPEKEMFSIASEGIESPCAATAMEIATNKLKVPKEGAAGLLCLDTGCGNCTYVLQGGCYNRVGAHCGKGCTCLSCFCGGFAAVLKRLSPSCIQPDGAITRPCTKLNASAYTIEVLSLIALEQLARAIFWKRMGMGLCVVSALLLAGLAYVLLR